MVRPGRAELLFVGFAIGFLVGVLLTVVMVETGTAKAKSRCDRWVSPNKSLVHIVGGAPGGATICLTEGVHRIGTREIEPKSRMRIVGVEATSVGRGHVVAPSKIRGHSPTGIFDLADTTGVLLKKLDLCCTPSGGHDSNPYGRTVQPGKGPYRMRYVRIHGAANQATGGCAAGSVFNHVEFDHNGSQAFRGHSAGVKCVRAFRVSNSYIHDNGPTSNGAWCDGGCDGGTFVVANSVFHDNGRKGIHYEISGGDAVIRGNRVFHNNHKDHQPTGGGIKVTSSRHVRVFGNTTWGNWWGGVVVDKDHRGYELESVSVRRNTLSDALRGCQNSGVVCRGNR